MGSEGQQKTCNFDPQSFVVMSYLGVPLWRAGEQMGVELSLQPGASGVGHREFLYLRPIVPKDPFSNLWELLYKQNNLYASW